jgi:hypothetical protein
MMMYISDGWIRPQRNKGVHSLDAVMQRVLITLGVKSFLLLLIVNFKRFIELTWIKNNELEQQEQYGCV